MHQNPTGRWRVITPLCWISGNWTSHNIISTFSVQSDWAHWVVLYLSRHNGSFQCMGAVQLSGKCWKCWKCKMCCDAVCWGLGQLSDMNHSIKKTWVTLKAKNNLSSVKPLQLLSFRLLGHRLLLRPPLSLCTQLGQEVHNLSENVHTCKHTMCDTTPHCTNLLIGCQVFIFILTRGRLFQILLTGGWIKKKKKWKNENGQELFRHLKFAYICTKQVHSCITCKTDIYLIFHGVNLSMTLGGVNHFPVSFLLL